MSASATPSPPSFGLTQAHKRRHSAPSDPSAAPAACAARAAAALQKSHENLEVLNKASVEALN